MTQTPGRDIVLHYKGSYYSLDRHDWRPKPVDESVRRRASDAIGAGLELGRLPAREGEEGLVGATCFVADLDRMAERAASNGVEGTWMVLNVGATAALDLRTGEFTELPGELRPALERFAEQGVIAGQLVAADVPIGTFCVLLNFNAFGEEAAGKELILHRQGRYLHLDGSGRCPGGATEESVAAAERALAQGVGIGQLCTLAGIGTVCTLVDLDALGEASTLLVRGVDGQLQQLNLDGETSEPAPGLSERAHAALSLGTTVGLLQDDASFVTCYLLDLDALTRGAS